jgi:hypothetical protein
MYKFKSNCKYDTADLNLQKKISITINKKLIQIRKKNENDDKTNIII